VVTFHPTEIINVTRNVNLKRGLLECSSTKRREQFEVVSGERYQHELAKLSKSKDVCGERQKMESGQTRGCHRRYLP
jgi:hypothetical protein